jgi:hypothetical protein
MIFKRLDFSLQKNRDKMIWTDRDMVLVAAIAMCVGWFFGYFA